MSWEDLRTAVSAPSGAEDASPSGEATVVVGGREISIPAPTTAGEILSRVGNTPADTMYIVVSEAGRKLPADEEVPPGARVFLVPVRVDG